MHPVSFLKNKSYKTPRISRLYLQLRSKFALSFLLLILVPFLLFVFGACIHSRSVLEKSTWEGGVSILEYNQKALYKLLDELDTGTGDATQDPMTILNVGSVRYSHFNPAIAAWFEGIYIIEGDKVSAVWQKDNVIPVFNKSSEQKWFVRAEENPQSTTIFGTNQRFYSEGKNTMVFSVARVIKSGSSSTPASILLLDFDYKLLQDIMEPAVSSLIGLRCMDDTMK